MMNKMTKYNIVLFIIFVCMLGYSLYKWYSYKHIYSELQREINQTFSMGETLSPIDCLVISGDKEAYLKCNVEEFKNMQGNEERQFSHRDYLLYCYIFAIRDGNSCAATDFVSYYLNDIENNKIVADVAVLKEAERLSLRAICDTSCYGDAMIKFFAAESLKEIYNGTYSEVFKDTLLYQQYCDSLSKYAKLL